MPKQEASSCPRLAALSSALARPAVLKLSALPEHAAHQLGGTANAGLAQNIGAVVFDRAGAQSQRLRDLLGVLAQREPFQHLPFAAAEMHLIAEIGGDSGAGARY